MKCAHPMCSRAIGLVSHRRGIFKRRLYCSRACRNDYAMAAPAAASHPQSRILPPRRRSGVADKRSLGVIGLVLAGVTFAVVLVAGAVVEGQVGRWPDVERASEQVMAARPPALSR